MTLPAQGHIRSVPAILAIVAGMMLFTVGLPLPATAQLIPDGFQERMPREWLHDARDLEQRQEFDRAIATYREYLILRPEDDDTRARLARLLSWQGQYQEALALYEDILSRHPLDLDVRIAVARVTSWQKRLTTARILYEAILLEDPENVEARHGLADVLFWTGQHTEALRYYEQVHAKTSDPQIADRVQTLKTEIARLTPLQGQRAPVGLTPLLPTLPFRNYFKVGYSHFTYTDRIPDERTYRLEAAHALGAQTLIGRIEPMDRFGFHDTQVSGEIYSPFWQKAWGYLGASGTPHADFAPSWSVGGEVFQGLGILHHALSFLEPSVGYRHMSFRTADVGLLMPGLTIYLPANFWLTEKLFYVAETGAMTLSSQLTWRPAHRVQFFASGGFGTAGERITATQDFTRVASRILQGGAIFPLSRYLSAETSVYYEDRGVLYIRRGGTLNLIYHW